MYRSLVICALIGGLLGLGSCSKVVYTHQQVLQNLHTQDDVLKKFGAPDEKVKNDAFEQWTYVRDSTNKINKPAKVDTVTVQSSTTAVGKVTRANEDLQPGSISRPFADTLQSAQPIPHDKFISFIFDPKGQVTGYKTQGVDLTQKGKMGFGESVLTVFGTIVAVGVIVVLKIYSDDIGI